MLLFGHLPAYAYYDTVILFADFKSHKAECNFLIGLYFFTLDRNSHDGIISKDFYRSENIFNFGKEKDYDHHMK